MQGSPVPRAHRWLRRLDTLRVKLFLAIAGADIVLVTAAYLIYGWSFDQGLVEYLNRADEARLAPLVARLAEGHAEHGDWNWLTADRERWPQLLREQLGVSYRGGGRRGGDDHAGPPAPASGASEPFDATASAPPFGPPPAASEPPLTIDPRMLLLDADQRVIIGPPERAAQAVLKPIVSNRRTVGWLAYVPRLQVVASLERAYHAQQSHRFAAIAAGLLAAGLIAAAAIAHWLARRIRALKSGAAALAQGDYAARIPEQGHDELAQLAHEFNGLAAALEAAQRARQQWIADIAHELRTPLATLRAEIEALQDGVRPLTQAGVASLSQEVGQLTRLVEDLRLLSLSDMGALTCRKERMDLGELVDDALFAGRSAIAEHGLQAKLDLDPGVRVLADGERIGQVVANLLQNTLRYTEAPAKLEVRLRAEGGSARLTWQDSPPGVPAADLPRLTERLFRVDASRARASGGSGLGLAIVKAIVEAHGGTLAASASALGGLRWDIVLPLAEGAHG